MNRYWFNPLHDEKDIKAHYVPADYGVNVQSRFSKSMLDYLNNTKAYLPIPDEVFTFSKKWRPTPLRRVETWEKLIGSPNPVYIKDETDTLLGSYKLNTAIAHAYFSKIDKHKGLAGETLAGHWGLSMAFAANCVGIKCKIVIHESILSSKTRYARLIEELGAEVIPCEGKGDALELSRAKALAIAEELDWGYAVGCSFPHVLAHQSVIGMDILDQVADQNIEIGALVACCGSGSNLGGTTLPIIHFYRQLGRKLNVFAGVRDKAERPDDIKAKGLTGHNFSKIIEKHVNRGEIKLKSIKEAEAQSSIKEFFRTEGILLAPETGYALAAVKQILKDNDLDNKDPIIVNLSGRGYWE